MWVWNCRRKATEETSVLHILTKNVPACCAKPPLSQSVGVALSPNTVINKGAGKSRPLWRKITGWSICKKWVRTSRHVARDDWQEETSQKPWGWNIREKQTFGSPTCFLHNIVLASRGGRWQFVCVEYVVRGKGTRVCTPQVAMFS